MTLLYKLLIFFCFLGATISVPILSAGITFGSTIYRPIGTPIYYERPSSDYYYYDNGYYERPSAYPFEYSPNYDYVGGGVGGGGIGGFYGSIGYSPILF